jgi:predicted PurR-regulated permease PerM
MTDRFYPRLFAIVALAILGWALFKIFVPFLGSILWSVLLAFLLEPINLRLKRRFRGRAGLVAGLLTVAATLMIAVPAVVLAVMFSGQATELLARLSQTAARLHLAHPSDVMGLKPVASGLSWLEVHLSLTADQIQEWAVEAGRKGLQLLAQQGGALLIGFFGLVLNLVLTLFLLFFFIRDGAEMAERFQKIMPMSADRKERLARQIGSVTRAVVVGTLVTALIQGTLVGMAFAVVGFPSPLVFGVITAAVSLLPVGGTALVWAPGAIVLALQGRWGSAIGLAIYGIVIVGMVDNLIKPRLISGQAQIETLPVFFGVLGGLAAFGFIGMFLGPIVIALALAILRFAEEDADANAKPATKPVTAR